MCNWHKTLPISHLHQRTITKPQQTQGSSHLTSTSANHYKATADMMNIHSTDLHASQHAALRSLTGPSASFVSNLARRRASFPCIISRPCCCICKSARLLFSFALSLSSSSSCTRKTTMFTHGSLRLSKASNIPLNLRLACIRPTSEDHRMPLVVLRGIRHHHSVIAS